MEQDRLNGAKRDKDDFEGLDPHENDAFKNNGGNSETDDDDDETDDDEDDYGPSPVAGIWAGSKKLLAESEVIADGDYNQTEEPYNDTEGYEQGSEAEADETPSAHKRLRL
jgi:hypothetical protein